MVRVFLIGCFRTGFAPQIDEKFAAPPFEKWTAGRGSVRSMCCVRTRVGQGVPFAGVRPGADVYGFMNGWWFFTPEGPGFLGRHPLL